MSTTTTFCASDGPPLVTTIVNVPLSPAFRLVGNAVLSIVSGATNKGLLSSLPVNLSPLGGWAYTKFTRSTVADGKVWAVKMIVTEPPAPTLTVPPSCPVAGL